MLSELEMRHQVPLEARDMNGPLGRRPSPPLLDRWSWAWARDLPLRAWSGGRFFCRELLTSLIRLCPKLACLCPHLFRLRGREVATVSESLCLTQWLDRSPSRLKTRGKPRANNIMARPMGPGPVLLGFPPAMLSPPGPLGLGLGPGPPTAGWVWREGHPPRMVRNLISPSCGARR